MTDRSYPAIQKKLDMPMWTLLQRPKKLLISSNTEEIEYAHVDTFIKAKKPLVSSNTEKIGYSHVENIKETKKAARIQ